MNSFPDSAKRNILDSQSTSWSSPFIRLLQKRGLDSKEKLDEFLSWDLKDLPILSELKDLKKAATRIIQAIDNKEMIAIYGDYDVDGTTSCALLHHFFKILNYENLIIYQPGRFSEGYGIHSSAITSLKEQGVDLVISVDCGITNHEAAEVALSEGMTLIITDHHKDVGEEIPKAFAIVNPNRRDEDLNSPLCSLAGVGVAFVLSVEIKKLYEKEGRNIPSIYSLLSFVAVGSLCDLVPLNFMNLKLVRHGLKLLKEKVYPGFNVFFAPEDFRGKMVSAENITFGVGPLINSKGRLEHPDHSLKLLISSEINEARKYYVFLDESNKERKIIQSQVFKEAKQEVINHYAKHSLMDINIVYNPKWHEGVIGIVASKLVETFKVPAIVFTQSEEKGILKASARTAGDLHLFNLLQNCSDLFLKFGGHKAAAGLSLPSENLESFKNRIRKEINLISQENRTVKDFYDLELDFDEVTPKLLKEIDILGPFGMGNEVPIFKLSKVKLLSYKVMKELHIRWTFGSKKDPFKKLTGISFFYTDKWGTLSPEEIYQNQAQQDINIYFTLKNNYYNGKDFLQLLVHKIEFNSVQ